MLTLRSDAQIAIFEQISASLVRFDSEPKTLPGDPL
jgi:hypothetical protein